MRELPKWPKGMIGISEVKGFYGYLVGYDGKGVYVWSCWKPRGINVGPTWRMLKPTKCKRGGYYMLDLRSGGKRKNTPLHVIVAENFIGDRPVGMDVLHGPNGRHDNRPSNLSYGTRRQNCEDMLRDGTRKYGERVSGAKLTDDKVKEMFKLRSLGMSQAEIAEHMSVAKMTVSCVLRRATWKHVPIEGVS